MAEQGDCKYYICCLFCFARRAAGAATVMVVRKLRSWFTLCWPARIGQINVACVDVIEIVLECGRYHLVTSGGIAFLGGSCADPL